MLSSQKLQSVDSLAATPAAMSADELLAVAGAEVLDRRHLSQLQAMQVPGRGSLFLELVAIFRREAPLKLSKLQSALDSRDAEQTAKSAHAMVGSLSTLGARQMQHAMRALEYSAATSDWTQISLCHSEVLNAWQRLQERLPDSGAKEVL